MIESGRFALNENTPHGITKCDADHTFQGCGGGISQVNLKAVQGPQGKNDTTTDDTPRIAGLGKLGTIV